MFKKILIPIDGSAAARKAAEFAQMIAEKYASEIVLLHVVNLPIFAEAHGIDHMVPNMNEEEITAKILQPVLDNFKDTGTKVKTRIELTHPAKSIVNVASEEQVDLIVLGNRGLSGLSSLLLGSVSKEVVDSAHCSVLVVK